MKANIQAKVVEVVKDTEPYLGSTIHTKMVKLRLVTTKGRVETSLNNAQTVILYGDLFLKEMVANQMKIGATITITISDEDSSVDSE